MGALAKRDLRREVEVLLADLPEHWRLVPVRGKRPFLREWPRRARRAADSEAVGAWLERWPDCALALVTGSESGVLVIDVDAPGGDHAVDGLAAFTRLEEELGALPEGPWAETPSGGRHLFFAWPEGRPRLSNRSPEPGIDLRATNGCVVLPSGARTPNRRWRISPADLAPPPLPPRWLARILPVPRLPVRTPRPTRRPGVALHGRGERYAAAALRSAAERVANAPYGRRNDTLFREAASLARLPELDPAEIEAVLTDAALVAGLPDGEIEATIRSALRYRI